MSQLLARATRPRSIAQTLAWAAVLVPLLVVVSPWLADASTYGLHDWDVETSHRYLTKLSLLRFGQPPFWNPYACGGFPAWAFSEGAPNLVSPWLVPYLVLSIPVALRVEVIGSCLLGALGAFTVGAQFTRSPAARALVVALWAVDSRWSLQAAAGHPWHLLYAWMPWCLYFFERSRQQGAALRHGFALAACFALLVYGGGIYPLPHVVLALGVYATILSIAGRSVRPLFALAWTGALGFALAAPKLLPVLHQLARTPRLIASVETTSLRVLWLALTSRDQTLQPPVTGLPYAWHEYGLYVSVAGVVVLVAALAVGWTARETALKVTGMLFLVLGFGAFHAAAPWSLLHEHVPLFASQHVPSRFFYPCLLLLALGASTGIGRLLGSKPWLEVGATVVVLALALDVASVARYAMAGAMRARLPPIDAAIEFHHEQAGPFRAMPMYTAMLRNQGVIDCYGATADYIGALSVSDPRYEGDVVVTPPGAAARVADWTPNRVVVESPGIAPGSTLVYDMNYDDGWSSDEGPVVDDGGKVAIQVVRPTERVTLVYRPPLLTAGLLLAALGAAVAGAFAWRARRA